MYLQFNYVLRGEITQLLVLRGAGKVFLNRGVSLLSVLPQFILHCMCWHGLEPRLSSVGNVP